MSLLGWETIGKQGAQQDTFLEFMPAGCQYRNGLVERVKAINFTLDHMLRRTLILNKSNLTYAKLCTMLARASNFINDRPIGVCHLT